MALSYSPPELLALRQLRERLNPIDWLVSQCNVEVPMHRSSIVIDLAVRPLHRVAPASVFPAWWPPARESVLFSFDPVPVIQAALDEEIRLVRDGDFWRVEQFNFPEIPEMLLVMNLMRPILANHHAWITVVSYEMIPDVRDPVETIRSARRPHGG